MINARMDTLISPIVTNVIPTIMGSQIAKSVLVILKDQKIQLVTKKLESALAKQRYQALIVTHAKKVLMDFLIVKVDF